MNFEPRGHRLLGPSEEGAVRVVSDAEEIALRRRVRLVSLNPGVSPTSPLAESVRREAVRLAQFDHPALPKVFSFVDDENELWFTMTPLGERSFGVDLRLPLPRDVALEVALEVAHALEHIHERGSVHGELTLASLSLSNAGQLVVDGAGRTFDDSSFEPLDSTRPLGFAPEITLGEPLSPSADLFCLGAILYELSSGRAPFGNPRAPDYPKRLRHEQPPRLVVFGIDEDLERFCLRCLSKTPLERPSSASEAARELALLVHPAEAGRVRAYFAGTPAEPTTTAPTPVRPRRRGPLLVVGALLGAIGLAIGIASLVARAPRSRESEPEPATRLLSTTEGALLLRVVATPWAHVYVDGAHLETTPFATPLRLSPGKHEIELRHPNAAPERRTIDGTAGQAVLLDVSMHTSALPLASPKNASPADTTP